MGKVDSKYDVLDLLVLTQEVPLAVEHVGPQVGVLVLQLQIHLSRFKSSLHTRKASAL